MELMPDQNLDNMDPAELAAIEAKVMEVSSARAEKFPTTEEGIDEFLNSMPLLATGAPKADSDEMEAIAELIAETPLAERAGCLKDSGNLAFTLGREGEEGRFRHALIYYTQALDVKCEDKSVNSAIFSNRALVHMTMESYGHCIQDCMQSIKLVATNVKPYYRAAQAASKLKKYKQALQFIEGGLKACKAHMLIAAEEKSFKVLANKCRKALVVEAAEAKAKKAAAATQQVSLTKAEKALQDAISQRKILVGEPFMDMSGWAGYDAEKRVDQHGSLHWPALLLYEEVMQSDFVKDFDETTTFREQLNVILPPTQTYAPWDTQKQYSLDTIRLFVEIKGKRKEVSLDATLASVINHQSPKFVVPALPTFFVALK